MSASQEQIDSIRFLINRFYPGLEGTEEFIHTIHDKDNFEGYSSFFRLMLRLQSDPRPDYNEDSLNKIISVISNLNQSIVEGLADYIDRVVKQAEKFQCLPLTDRQLSIRIYEYIAEILVIASELISGDDESDSSSASTTTEEAASADMADKIFLKIDNLFLNINSNPHVQFYIDNQSRGGKFDQKCLDAYLSILNDNASLENDEKLVRSIDEGVDCHAFLGSIQALKKTLIERQLSLPVGDN